MSSQTEFDNIKVLLIGQNKNINVAPFKIDENKVNIKKDAVEPFFDAECIFSIKEICTIPLIGRFISSRRKRQPCVIYLYGKQHCEKLKAPLEDQSTPTSTVDPQNVEQEKLGENKDKMIGNLFEPLTNKERVEIVKREIAKALRKFQPFSNTIVIILILLLLANLILTIMGLKGMRI